ncbi:MAG: Dihydroorotase [Roseomonas sp.]|nr:Dihydroorotase [Roseomonas sp.]
MVDEFDLLVAGAAVATGQGLRRADLGIRAGEVAAWLEPGARAGARETIDATGLVVLPGLVDAHVHFREPGLEYKEGFFTGTAAAAAGGVTTAMVMPTDNPFTLTAADVAAKRDLAAGKLHVDIGLQAAATGAAQVAALAAAGVVSIEVFLGDIAPALLLNDTGRFAAILRAAREAGIVVGVTPADDGVIAAALAACRDGGDDRMAFFRSRPPLSEAAGTALAVAVADATGAAVHLRQISCRASLAFLREARMRGLDISAETTPHNLLLGEDEIREQGPFAKVLPPLRPQEDIDALWMALRDGTLDMVATDHAPHQEAEKRAGLEDIWAAPGGFPGVQTLLPLLLDAIAAGRMGWPDLLRLCCEAPARRFGLYPRKGSLEPGADADLVIVDAGRAGVIRNEDQLSRARITPFAGRRVTGWPVATVLRGQIVARDGKVVGAPRGRVLARPAG